MRNSEEEARLYREVKDGGYMVATARATALSKNCWTTIEVERERFAREWKGMKMEVCYL